MGGPRVAKLALLSLLSFAAFLLVPASATRPAQHAQQSGELSAEDAFVEEAPAEAGASGDSFLDSLLLPQTCGPDGVIALQSQVMYRTAGNHSIDASCHELRGAVGAKILVSADGISFASNHTVLVRGPVAVTMAPGVQRLNAAALRSRGDLRVQASANSTVEFKNIASLKSTWGGAALSAEGSIVLEGEGFILFENLHTAAWGAAASSLNFAVNSTVADLLVRNSSSVRCGGAFFGASVLLNSSSSAVMENCTTSLYGGAITAVQYVMLAGGAQYVFRGCSSHSHVEGGAALSIKGNISVELSSGGFLEFQECRLTSPHAGGGAVWSSSDVNINSGIVRFQDCSAQSGYGHAVFTGRGTVRIGEDADVSLGVSPDASLYARNVELPVGGSLLPRDVIATSSALASKSRHQSETVCPAGSRFRLSASGLPDWGKCTICKEGTASLRTAIVNVSRQVRAFEAGMQIVLVRKGSPNALTLKALYALIGNCEGGLGVHRGSWDPDRKYFPLKLHHHCELTFQFVSQHELFDHNVYDLVFRTTDGDLLAVPWGSYIQNTPLVLVRQGAQHLKGDQGMYFQVDKSTGYVSPVQSPEFVIGIGHDVLLQFHPTNPYEACVPCPKTVAEAADKIWCKGGTHVSSLPGSMLLHTSGAEQLHVHLCPNSAACPGSNISFTAEGQLTNHIQLCADGYETSPGCVKCQRGYGRPQFDPFTCQACGNATLLQRVGAATVSSSVFYITALMSTRPRTKTQQIFKIFLAFVTISCRSLSAFPHTEHYQRLKNDLYASARALYRLFFAMDLVVTVEPGSGFSSFDCWKAAPVNLSESLGLAWAIPSGLFLLSCLWSLCWPGATGVLQSWLVWSNVFMPALVGAAARLLPCFATQEKGDRMLMYEPDSNTLCASSLADMFRLPRFWLAVGTGVALLLLGPVLWLSLMLRKAGVEKHDRNDANDASYEETIAFLVAGYKPMLRWWELTVLVRKTAIFVVATWFPMSWAPGLHLVFLLTVTVSAELVHVTVRPYTSSTLNRLEAQVLGISSACLVLVISLLVDWPFRPYAVYVTISALLFLLTFGVYGYFLYLCIQAQEEAPEMLEISEQAEAEEQ